MKKFGLAAIFALILMLCSCGKQITSYRIYDDTLVSFTQALGDRTLVSEKLDKSEDGRIITKAEYTYKSDKADEDRENYLYYLLNNRDATFISDDAVVLDSRDEGYAIVIRTSAEDNKFTISLTRRSHGSEE